MADAESMDDKLRKWMDGELTPEEWETIKAQSPEREKLEEWEKLMGHGGDWTNPEPKLATSEAWNNIDALLEEEPKAREVRWGNWRYWSAAASIALVIAMTWWLWPANEQLTIYASVAQQVDHQLPDGSVIQLNAGSEINYAPDSWSQQREIQLVGEGFFEVEKGSSFRVITANGSVRVLGTSFNVRSRDTSFEVACVTGRVEVKIGDQVEVLEKGQTTRRIANGLSVPESFESRVVLGWQQGEFYFQDQALNTVFGELERQFGVSIRTREAIQDRLYTGFFNNQDLTNALNAICIPMGLTFEIKGNQVTVQ